MGVKILQRVDLEISMDCGSDSDGKWKDYGDYDDHCDWHDAGTP